MGYCGVCGVYFVSETAQVELKSPTSVSLWSKETARLMDGGAGRKRAKSDKTAKRDAKREAKRAGSGAASGMACQRLFATS